MILATASAAHGYNLAGKGVIVSATVIAYALLGYLYTGWWGTSAGVLAGLWWPVFRSGKQAHIEMQYMDTGNPPHPSLYDVLKAHYFVGFFTIIALKLYNYSSPAGQKLGWEKKAVDDGGYWHGKKVRLVDNDTRVHHDDFPFWDCRRPTEFATGLTGDIILLLLLVGGVTW